MSGTLPLAMAPAAVVVAGGGGAEKEADVGSTGTLGILYYVSLDGVHLLEHRVLNVHLTRSGLSCSERSCYMASSELT